jgi:hypothetical protein
MPGPADREPAADRLDRQISTEIFRRQQVAIRAVQELLGHASILVTQRYAHLAPHVSQDAVCLLDGPSAAPSERPAPVEPMPPAPAPAAPTPAPAPARVKTAREARAERTKAKYESRSVDKESARTADRAATQLTSLDSFRALCPTD